MNVFVSYFIATATCIFVPYLTWKIARTFERPLQWMLLGGFAVRLVFLLSVRPSEQTNDWQDHVSMIRKIADEGILRHAGDCFECYHPPLYHAINASFLHPFLALGGDVSYTYQWLQMGFFMLALVAFVDFLRKLTADRKTLYLASLLTIFWPRGIPMSAAINNDVGACVTTALALSAIVTVGGEVKAAWYTVAGLLMKTNTILMYPILLGYRLYQSKSRSGRFKFPNKKMLAVLGLGLALSAAFTVYNRNGVSTNNLVVGNVDKIEPQFSIGNKFENFACFQLMAFVTYPEVDVGDDKKGRQCFWNVLLKTGIVTDQGGLSPYHRVVANILEPLLLVLVLLGFAGMTVLWRKNRDALVLHCLTIGFFTTAILILRVDKPLVCSGDFRYIFTVVPAVATFVASGPEAFEKFPALKKASVAVILLFVVLSAAYYGVMTI